MLVQRALSSVVRQVLLHAPVERGTWMLRRRTSPWLVARLPTGPWIRVSGVSSLEWAVFEGRESPEARTLEVFLARVRAGMTVIDVGSNIGLYTLPVAARVGPSGRVIAIEPNPIVARRLRENLARNWFHNVSVIEAAATDVRGTLQLHLGDDSECSSLYGEAGFGSIDVRATTVDEQVQAAALPRVDLLKIDVEGAELSALRGAEQLLAGPDPPVLLVEANPVTLRAAGTSIAALRDCIESFGYRISVVQRIVWGGAQTENWLATPTRDDPPVDLSDQGNPKLRPEPPAVPPTGLQGRPRPP